MRSTRWGIFITHLHKEWRVRLHSRKGPTGSYHGQHSFYPPYSACFGACIGKKLFVSSQVLEALKAAFACLQQLFPLLMSDHRLSLLPQENVYASSKKFTSFKKVACDLNLAYTFPIISLHSTSKGEPFFYCIHRLFSRHTLPSNHVCVPATITNAFYPVFWAV